MAVGRRQGLCWAHAPLVLLLVPLAAATASRQPTPADGGPTDGFRPADLQRRAADLRRRGAALAAQSETREAALSDLRVTLSHLQAAGDPPTARLALAAAGAAKAAPEALQARARKNLELRAELKNVNERITALRAEALFSRRGAIEQHLQDEASKSSALLREEGVLQRDQLASRAELEDLRAAAEVEERGLEANRSVLAEAVRRQDVALAALDRNTTGLREEAAGLIRQRGEVRAQLAGLGGQEQELSREESHVGELQRSVKDAEQQLTQARASLLFGNSVGLRRSIAAQGRRNRALWQRRGQLERKSLEVDAALKKVEDEAARLEGSAKRGRASTATLQERSRQFQKAERRLAARGERLKRAKVALVAADKRAKAERGELARELVDLGAAP